MYQDNHKWDLICQNARWKMDDSDLMNVNFITDVTVVTAGPKNP